VACGDVMPGCGIDQILPHPGGPELWEDWARDPNAYVRLAVHANGPIPRPVGFSWPWGDALPAMEQTAPDVQIVNLETSVTRSADFASGKVVHYRMNPNNLPHMAAIRPDVCALANNHVLDFGERGLRETLGTLAGAGWRWREPDSTRPRPGRPLRGQHRPRRAAQREPKVPVSGQYVTASSGSPGLWSGVPRK